jgi:glycosyltransferase involved in cell wall biosynthesis
MQRESLMAGADSHLERGLLNGNPIRALFVVPDLKIGGAERHVTTLLPQMDASRFTSSVVCIGNEGELFESLVAARIEARALHRGKRQAIRALRELVRIMQEVQPDVVVVRGYNAETLGRIAARIAGVPHTVMWVHNIGDATPRSKVRATVDRLLTPWTSSYFGVAEAQQQYMVNELGYPADKIRIIYNGVDPALFDAGPTERGVLAEFGLDDSDAVVGILAALRPEKDHATLLRAARIVIDKIPRARFLVIGDGATRPHLEALCADLQISSHVHFAGARSDVTTLLRAIDVFTLSSATVECFPIALLEAMACARPAVCTAVGGVPEMIHHGETGYLVPPKDPRQLANRLVSLLSSPQSARRMGLAGRRRVEAEFSLDRSVAAAQQALEDVVCSGARPLDLPSVPYRGIG